MRRRRRGHKSADIKGLNVGQCSEEQAQSNHDKDLVCGRDCPPPPRPLMARAPRGPPNFPYARACAHHEKKGSWSMQNPCDACIALAFSDEPVQARLVINRPRKISQRLGLRLAVPALVLLLRSPLGLLPLGAPLAPSPLVPWLAQGTRGEGVGACWTLARTA